MVINWKWLGTYVFNLDSIVIMTIIIVVLYFLFTKKKKRYGFTMLDRNDIGNESVQGGSQRRRKTKRKGKKKFKHEEKCREIFQDIYGVKFKSVRPDFLKNPTTGRNLELDGYNSEIETHMGTGLAFEYDGKQHAEYSKHFHKHGPKQFLYACKTDQYKDAICKKRGIALVRIPHFIPFDDLKRYIQTKLKRGNLLP